MTSPLAELDSVIHAPKRLAAMAILASTTGGTSFAFLREHLQLSDSDLSKQMSALASWGYVKIHKVGHGHGSSTDYTITREGDAAYRKHRAALQALLREGG